MRVLQKNEVLNFKYIFLLVLFGISVLDAYSQTPVDTLVIIKSELNPGPTVSESDFASMARMEVGFLQALLDDKRFVYEVNSRKPILFEGKLCSSIEYSEMELRYMDSIIMSCENVPNDSVCSSIYFNNILLRKKSLRGQSLVIINSERVGKCLFRYSVRIEFVIKRKKNTYVVKRLKTESTYSEAKTL